MRHPVRRARSSTATGRASVVAAVVAAVVAVLVPATDPASAETTGPAVVHVPVTTAPYGQPIPITLTATCATGAACAARLYYRATVPAALAAVPGVVNEAGFTLVGLSASAATTTANGQDTVPWSGQIPGAAATTTGIDYFLEVEQNGALTRFPGTTYAAGIQPSATYVHVLVLMPPLLNHVPVPVAVADRPVDVDAQVSCSSGNCEATLYYRTNPSTNTLYLTAVPPTLPSESGWTPADMHPQGAGTPLGGAAVLLTYRGQIPGPAVSTAGVDYYIRVTDGHTQAFSPGTVYEGWYAPRDGQSNSRAPHHIHVLEPPRIVHQPVLSAPYGRPIAISATTNCPSGRSCTATLYYDAPRPGVLTGSAYSARPMTVTRLREVDGVDVVSVDGEVPASDVDTRGVKYFIIVDDGKTTSYWPGWSSVDGPGVWENGEPAYFHYVHVQEPPHIVHVPPTTAPALQDLVIQAELTCATAACSATLFYNGSPTDISGVYQSTAMTRVAVRATTTATRTELWEGRVPASAVTTRGLAYHMTATDGYTNTAAPGTSYWGAYASVDGSNPAPALARFVVRVVDPPHPVHAPPGIASRNEPLALRARSNCATHNCRATLYWRVTGLGWQTATMDGTQEVPPLAYGNELLVYDYTIPAVDVTEVGVEYRIEVTDGYVTETTPTYPVVVTDRPAPGGTGTAVAFVPPVVQGPVNDDVPLVVKATWADGSPFAGPVRWCAIRADAGPTSTSCVVSGTATATTTSGNASFTVRPTTANPTLRVTAYADRSGTGFNSQDTTEASGAAAVVGIPPVTPPDSAGVTTVVLTPPPVPPAQGSPARVTVRATRGNGQPFSGPVYWGSGAPGSLSTPHLVTTAADGTATFSVTPTAATPVVQIVAFADASGNAAQDTTEARGTAAVTGTPTVTPPPVTPPTGTTVTFEPTAPTPQGSAATVRFSARSFDGSALSNFSGRVRYAVVPAGTAPPTTYPSYVDVTGGSGIVTVTPTAADPVTEVFAYADRAGTGYADRNDNEALGATGVVGTPPVTPPPTSAPATSVSFDTAVSTGATGSARTLTIRAKKADGSAFAGKVRWGATKAGFLPGFFDEVTTGPAGTATVTVTPTAAEPVLQVSAYADIPGAGFGSHDLGEVAATAAVLGDTAPPAPGPGTEVVFPNPLLTATPGVGASVRFQARNHDGSPFVGCVRWGTSAPGESPAFSNLECLDARRRRDGLPHRLRRLVARHGGDLRSADHDRRLLWRERSDIRDESPSTRP